MESILIVDDEKPIRILAERCLRNFGYDCRTAADAQAARRLLKENDFDLILCDINMPGESGLDLVSYIKVTYPATAIVMMSVIDDPGKAKLALEIGVYGYVVKPFTPNIILINVENALRRNQLEIEKKAYLNKLEALVRQRSEKLNNQLFFLQNLIDAIPSPMFYKDTKGIFQGCNAAFETLMGTKREAILGKTAADIFPSDQSALFMDTDRKLIASPGELSYEATLPHSNGGSCDFLFNKATYHDATGKIAGLVGVMIDITERKLAKEALRVSEEKFRQIVENIGIGAAMINADMEILWMNRQMRAWFPDVDTAANPICHRAFNTPPRANRCDNCPTVKALQEGTRFETTSLDPVTVGNHQFRIIASPIHDKHGNVVAAIEIVEDVTQKILLERELRQAQKLESIGQLAAGIAHEINTPTQYIGDNTRFVQDAVADLMMVLDAYERLLAAAKAEDALEAPVRAVDAQIASADLDYLRSEIPLAIEQTLEGVSRVSKIVSSMRHFSHPGADKKTPVDLNKALETTITVARNEWKYVADLETDFDATLPMVACLPGEMNQVFLNLLINAAHAIGEFTDDGKRGKGLIRVSTHHHNGSVQIRIADTGTGIPEKIQQRIFDPFFTTKGVGKGTGQGLAIAHNVITEKHGGTIRFEPRSGQGTTFIIDLPIEKTCAGKAADET